MGNDVDGRIPDSRKAHCRAARSGGSSQPGGSEELKSREYRDNQGEVHHHTKTYEEQHGKNKGKNAA